MVLVALAAVGMGGYDQSVRLRRLGREYRNKAADHAGSERLYSSEVAASEQSLSDLQLILADLARRRDESSDEGRRRARGAECDDYRALIGVWRRYAADCRTAVAHHAELASKYRRAASRPWLPITRDPPGYVDPWIVDSNGN
jgi:hypothetical protein